jgi:hypothetical protein
VLYTKPSQYWLMVDSGGGLAAYSDPSFHMSVSVISADSPRGKREEADQYAHALGRRLTPSTMLPLRSTYSRSSTLSTAAQGGPSPIPRRNHPPLRPLSAYLSFFLGSSLPRRVVLTPGVHYTPPLSPRPSQTAVPMIKRATFSLLHSSRSTMSDVMMTLVPVSITDRS